MVTLPYNILAAESAFVERYGLTLESDSAGRHKILLLWALGDVSRSEAMRMIGLDDYGQLRLLADAHRIVAIDSPLPTDIPRLGEGDKLFTTLIHGMFKNG